MSRFVLTAQLQLQAPNNVAQVVRQIQSQLNNVSVNVQVQGAAQAQRQIQQVANQTNQAATAAERMGKAFAVSVRRFAAFSIATRAVGLFTSTLSDAVQIAIDFERQMVKVSQVTGDSLQKLKGLSNTITSLATSMGVGSQSLLEVSTVLLQAGLNAKDTEVALKSLAKAALAPNFDSISETAEGAIAILAQFQEGVGALEAQLGSINAVAGAFAVEAGDLIDVIRRTGGVFKASGGSLNELLALFTSVRATTRESAESIGTGLRTIFTRIQRPKTIEFLKQFGVELVDLEGKFVGPFEAVKRLSSALAGLGEGDLTFIRVAEELGGFRQIGKVLPLLQQFSTAQAALNVAQSSGNSLTKDAATAQQALAIRILKVKEEFLALVRSITETSTFQIMANTALSLASALIKLSDSIKPLLPLLGALAAVKIAKGLGSFAGGILGGLGSSRTFNQGGRVHKFARGGLVPGSGNRDTVPAMLSPGEFVIRKSSVNKLGTGTLAAMNENKLNRGGVPTLNARNALLGKQKLTPQEMMRASKRAGYDIERLDNGRISLSRNGKIYHNNLTDDEASKLLSSMATGYNRGGITEASKKGMSTGDVLASARSSVTTPRFSKESSVGIATTSYLPSVSTGNVSVTRQDILNQVPGGVGTSLSKKFGAKEAQNALNTIFKGKNTFNYASLVEGIGKDEESKFATIINESISSAIDTSANRFATEVMGTSAPQKINKLPSFYSTLDQGFRGQLFENTISALAGKPLSGQDSRRPIDFTRGIGKFKSIYSNLGMDYVDAKITSGAAGLGKAGELTSAGSQGIASKIAQQLALESIPLVSNLVPKKTENQRQKELTRQALSGKKTARRAFATGGSVGTDTVPALLTPGEFVVNRQSAQSIGYGNLNRMNKVGKYAKGGIVQQFNTGTTGSGVSSAGSSTGGRVFYTTSQQVQTLGTSCQAASGQVQSVASSGQQVVQANNQQRRSIGDVVSSNKMFAASMVTSLISGFLPAIDENSSAMLKMTHNLLGLATTITSVGFALEAFGLKLSAGNIMEFFGSGPNSAGGLLTKGLKSARPKIGSAISSVRGGVNKVGNSLLQPITSRVSSIGSAAQQTVNPLTTAFGRGFQGAKRGINPLFSAAMPPGTQRMPGGTMAAQQLKTNIGQLGFGGRLAARAGGALGSSDFGKGLSGGLSGKSVIGGGSRSLSGNIGGLLGQGVLQTKSAISSATKGAGGIRRGLTSGFQGGRFGQSGADIASKLASRGVGQVGQIAAKFGNVVGQGVQLLSKFGTALSGAIGPTLAAAGAITVLNSVISSFSDAEQRKQKAIAKGDVTGAGRAAQESAALTNANNLRMGAGTAGALIGSLFGGPIGAAIGATIGAALGTVIANVAPQFAESISVFFGGNTTESAVNLAKAQAQAVKTQKAFERGQVDAQRAMEDFNNGTISAAEALSRMQTMVDESKNLQEANNKAIASNSENRSTGGFATARNIFTLGGLVGENANERNDRIDRENAEVNKGTIQARKQAFDVTREARNATIRSSLMRGSSVSSALGQQSPEVLRSQRTDLRMEQRRALARGDSGTADLLGEQITQLTGEIEETERSIENLKNEIEASKKSFEALNLGMRGPTATATAASLAISNFADSLEVGSIPIEQSSKVLQLALTEAGQAINPKDLQAALGTATSVLTEFGASEGSINKFKENVNVFNQAQKGFTDAFKQTRDNLQAQGKAFNPQTFKQEFAKNVQNSLGPDVSDEVKKRLGDVISGTELSNEELNKILATGDVSIFGNKITEQAQESIKDILKIFEEKAAIEKQLIQLTQKRIESERNFVEAQKEAIDLAMEGREVQGKYGGRAVTNEERRASIVAKANAGASRLGLSEMGTGSMADLRRRRQELGVNTASIEGRRRVDGGMQGVGGVEADANQQDLQKAYKDQIQTVRDLIKLEEDELRIIQEKNKLEKQSLESLISGDIDKFFEQQASVGAQAALATGDQRLINQFSGDAIGGAFSDLQRQSEAGVQSLYGQNLQGPGGLLERAGSSALASRGVQNPMATQVLAGTTAAEEASKARLRELGGELGQLGQLGADMAEMQVQTATINVMSANVKLQDVISRGTEAAQGLHRGGVVYANRGMFVPRGTDTVPAMLTPGEFVVNRAAVNRGNNLQLLQSINRGSSSSAGASTVGSFSRGGRVKYLQNGGLATGGSSSSVSISPEVVKQLAVALEGFNTQLSNNIRDLQNTKFKIALDTTNINVNLMGGSFLNSMKEDIKKELLSEVSRKIGQMSVGNGGKLTENRSTLPKG